LEACAAQGGDEEDEDNEGHAELNEGKSGFFDLEIQSAPQTNGKRDFLIAIESKIGADFEPGQLEKYRAELKKRSIDFSQSYLVTLTTHSTQPTLAHAHIKWSQVQELLLKPPLEENLKNLEIIYLQFADFLKEKGMAPMKIDIPKHWQNRSRSLVLTRSLDPKATKLGYIFANRLTPNITVMRTRFTNGCCPQRKNFRSYSRGNAEFFV